ncbi:MAG: F0F1 ATP synthase subunit epsilon [Planctomycetota bacterium]|nr:F0F1 ATP synthase subunit epsilon [Planctomycetota bacterium]
MAQLRCSIVSPAAELLNEEATYVSFQSWDGQYGVMAGGSPFLAKLGVGVTRVDTASGSRFFAVDGGFAQLQNNALTLLVDAATAAEEIVGKDAQDALDAANAKVNATNERPLSLVQREALEVQQQIGRVKLALAASRG